MSNQRRKQGARPPRIAGWHAAIWLVLLTVLAWQARAQDYGFRNYAQADGLQGLSVSTLYEDRDSVVWAGTELGLHRFERGRFDFVGRDAGIDSVYIRALAEDRAGRLWVASSNGLYLRIGGVFRNVLRDGQRVPVDLGNTLVAFGEGVVAVSGRRLLAISADADGTGRFEPLPLQLADGSTPDAGEALLAEGDALWSACGMAVCRRGSDGRTLRYGPSDGVPAGHWQALFRDSHGVLWLRGDTRVLAWEPGAPRFVERPAPAGAHFDVLLGNVNFVEDPQGRILTRSDSGIVRWDGHAWQVLDKAHGVGVTPSAGALLMQRDGRLWIATRGLGIQRWLAYERIEHWAEGQGVATSPIWSIQRTADGTLLVGGDAGSYRLDAAARRMRAWTRDDGQPLLQGIAMSTAADGAVWLGRSSGALARRDPVSGATRDVAMVPASVRTLTFDHAGMLWIGTGRGAFLLEPGARLAVPAPGLPMAPYDDGGYDRFGRLWMVGGKGLFVQRDGHWQAVPVPGPLPSHDFSRLSVAPDGEIWVSLSDAGLWHGRLDRDGVLQLQAVADPLVSEVMPYILRHDRKGRLWVGSSQGVDLYQDGRWKRITQAEGLLWDDMSANAFFEDADGSVWLGTSRGICHVLDPAGMFALHPLRVEIMAVRRALEPVHPGQGLLWSEAPLEIDVSTPGARGDADRISFHYRIGGYQARWSQTAQSHVSYPLLPPGRYAFEVQAYDARQRTVSAVARFPFEIFPPWWRSPFAVLVYVLGGFGLVLGVLHWRTQQLLARERELERLVAERTQELERDKQALEAARAELAVKATHDALTGLLNRAGILEAMRVAVAEAEADGQPLAALLIDLDHFKQINDQHGHLAGDGVLSRVGRRLNGCLRGSDRVGRYGGEELLAVLPGLHREAHNRLRALHDAVSATPYAIGEQVLEVTCSIGVAWHRPGESVEQLLARADTALYRAKHGGRNRIELESDSPMPA